MGRDEQLVKLAIIIAQISIHAPRMGRDPAVKQGGRRSLTISIHAPRMGRDPEEFRDIIDALLFQSTRPVWGATISMTLTVYSHPGISIHAPRMGRDETGKESRPPRKISIHAPRMGRDRTPVKADSKSIAFQSTRPVWGAT